MRSSRPGSSSRGLCCVSQRTHALPLLCLPSSLVHPEAGSPEASRPRSLQWHHSLLLPSVPGLHQRAQPRWLHSGYGPSPQCLPPLLLGRVCTGAGPGTAREAPPTLEGGEAGGASIQGRRPLKGPQRSPSLEGRGIRGRCWFAHYLGKDMPGASDGSIRICCLGYVQAERGMVPESVCLTGEEDVELTDTGGWCIWLREGVCP